MTKGIINADVLLLEAEKRCRYLGNDCDYDAVLPLGTLESIIKELATPSPAPQETLKGGLTKFAMHLFEAIGQNVEAGKLDISGDDFDKIENIALKLIDVMNFKQSKPQESMATTAKNSNRRQS